jgi:nicotinate-nucleotide adenylyltransferase
LKRRGLFGGSFNPPHRAHRALAELAIQALQLDELVLMPAGQPWQKAGTQLAPAQHRLAMLALQMTGVDKVRISNLEIERDGPSYSLDSIEALREPQQDWFLVIGQDQYARLSTWHRVEDLLAACTLAVAARGDQAVRADPLLPPHRCVRLDLPADAVSASQVRALLARDEDVTKLVGPEVAGYIAQTYLYRA